jgi:4-hydroxybenzoate polyprenyltransferase
MRFLHFILSHSIFVACCAVGLFWQTNLLLHLKADKILLGFIFFSTLCSYNFYWLLSKFYFSDRRIVSILSNENTSFIILLTVSILGTLFFLCSLQHIWLFIVVGFSLTLIYSMPLWPFNFSKGIQKIRFFKTVLLAFTWAYVTTILPAVHLLATKLLPILLLLAQRFLLMLLLCILFDLRDVSVDKMRGLHSLATDVSNKRMRTILGLVFASYLAISLLFSYKYGDLGQAIAFIIVGIICWQVYRLSFTKRGFVFYYFLVDGLMLVAALGTYIASIL